MPQRRSPARPGQARPNPPTRSNSSRGTKSTRIEGSCFFHCRLWRRCCGRSVQQASQVPTAEEPRTRSDRIWQIRSSAISEPTTFTIPAIYLNIVITTATADITQSRPESFSCCFCCCCWWLVAVVVVVSRGVAHCQQRRDKNNTNEGQSLQRLAVANLAEQAAGSGEPVCSAQDD